MVIVMPALHELSAEEMTDLAEGYKNQLMQEDTYRNFLAFTEKDRNSILADRPVSLSELKNRVKSIVASKTVKHKLTDMTEFDPAYYIADPDVARAARLGKRALRDKKLLSELLVKFEYNQAKIATLLGVNRSTVHRRCITYKLSESTLVKFAPLKKEVVSQEPESDQQAL
jgi:DNA-binding protein Fis